MRKERGLRKVNTSRRRYARDKTGLAGQHAGEGLPVRSNAGNVYQLQGLEELPVLQWHRRPNDGLAHLEHRGAEPYAGLHTNFSIVKGNFSDRV